MSTIDNNYNSTHDFSVLETKKQGYITDRDGNKYDTIHYKGYAIMVENLRTKTFANGDKIEEIERNEDWIANNNKQDAGWCYYNNEKSYYREHGLMYTSATISDLRDLAPDG